MSSSKLHIKYLIKSLYEFIQLSSVTVTSEDFENISISFRGSEEVLFILPTLYKAFSDTFPTKEFLSNSTGENIDLAEIIENIETQYFDFFWNISIKKTDWFSHDNQIITTFFDMEKFLISLEELDQFDPSNFFIINSNIQIILPMYVGQDVIGNNFIITNAFRAQVDLENNIKLPSDLKIKEFVHVMSNDAIRLDPQKFSFIMQDNDEFKIILRKKYAEVLLATIVQVFKSSNEVTIKGLKYFNTKINNNIIPDMRTVLKLEESVIWAYEENTSTRLQLLADRLSFYKNDDLSLMEIIINNIDEVLIEVKDRYKFIVTEKSEEYTKDLRELLKDTKEKTDKYSEKTRSIINSLLRDTLGSIFFLGLTVYSRFSSKEDFILSSSAQIIFSILGVYFLLSMIFQAVFNFWDIKLSQDEAKKWSESSMDYMTKETYNKYVTIPLSTRTRQFIYVQCGIIIIYLALAVLAFCAQSIIRLF